MENKKVIATETVYIEPTVNPGSPDGGERILKSRTEFDPEGRQLKESSWDLNGEYEQLLVSEYDEKGQLAKQDVYFDERHLSETRTFTYDDQGRLIKQVAEYIEGGKEEMLCHYNPDGMLVRREYLGEDGEEEALEINEFEEKKLLRSERTEYGEVVYSRERTYEDGLLVRETITEDQVETVIEMGYNGGELPETEREIVNGKLKESRKLSYDESGRPIREEAVKNGVVHTSVYQFDDAGNELFREETLPDGSLVMRVRRSTDEYGNLLDTEVEANTQGFGIDRHYKYIYEYTYHQQD